MLSSDYHQCGWGRKTILLVEAEDKRWARLRVMKIVADRLEEELG